MSTEVVMPQMGESIAEGTITKWLKQVGERIERDEPLFEISTDKVDAEIPSPSAGTLREIKAKEGETVAVNSIVAVIDDAASNGADDDAQPVALRTSAETSAPTTVITTPPPPPSPQSPPVAAAPPPPQQGAPGQSEILQPAVVPVAPAVATTGSATANEKSSLPAPSLAENGSEQTAEDLRRTRSSPLVRRIAQEHNVDISRLEGTGVSGRVTKNDILSFIESGATAASALPQSSAQVSVQPQAPPAQSAAIPQAASVPSVVEPLPAPPTTTIIVQPAEGDRVEAMSVMRKKIAEHMILSQRTSAHVTTVYEIDMTGVARIREKNKDAFFERNNTKLTFMPFIFNAVTGAIQRYPIFNAQVGSDQIIYKRDINLGMAVALDWGLIVPVIKRADELSIAGLARTANDLAERARTKQLKPDEVTGGTFTITNPGVFGGLFGTPVINQPQVAILAIGAIEKRPKVLTSPEGDDYLAIRSLAYFALSYDHRIVDGADAERFLSSLKEILEAGQFTV